MRPRDRVVVADADERHVDQARADDVQLARDDRVEAVETVRARPRVVRVAEERALPVPRREAAQGVRVAARLAREDRERRIRGDRRRVVLALVRGRRRRDRRDLPRHVRRAEVGADERPVVELVDLPHPGRAAAACVREVVPADVPHVPAHAGGEAADERPRLRRRSVDGSGIAVQPLLHTLAVPCVEQVARHVGVVRPAPEVERARPARRDDPVEQLAACVLHGRLAHAEPEPRVVRSLHVRDAVGRPADLCCVGRVLGGDRRGRAAEHGRHRARRRHDERCCGNDHRREREAEVHAGSFHRGLR